MRDLSVYSLSASATCWRRKPVRSRDFDTAEAQQRQAEANVAAAKATIARKTIRAPFTGELGIRLVNLGQYLNSGDKIVSLQALDPIRVNFTLPQQYRDMVNVGTDVELRTDATGDTVFKGKVNAHDSLVDATTRNFQVQATLDNKDGRLLPGHVRQRGRAAAAAIRRCCRCRHRRSTTRPTATRCSWCTTA